MSAGEYTDEQLMELLKQGQQSALTVLVQRYQQEIFRFCLHYLKNTEKAKDMAQEAFIRVYAARSRFDGNLKFKSWLLTIARNLCFNELKRQKLAYVVSIDEKPELAPETGDGVFHGITQTPDQVAMDAERQQMLADVIDTLGEEAREIITLRFFERMQAKEIGELLGASEGAIRTKLHRILKQLHKVCKQQIDDEE